MSESKAASVEPDTVSPLLRQRTTHPTSDHTLLLPAFQASYVLPHHSEPHRCSSGDVSFSRALSAVTTPADSTSELWPAETDNTTFSTTLFGRRTSEAARHAASNTARKADAKAEESTSEKTDQTVVDDDEADQVKTLTPTSLDSPRGAVTRLHRTTAFHQLPKRTQAPESAAAPVESLDVDAIANALTAWDAKYDQELHSRPPQPPLVPLKPAQPLTLTSPLTSQSEVGALCTADNVMYFLDGLGEREMVASIASASPTYTPEMRSMSFSQTPSTQTNSTHNNSHNAVKPGRLVTPTVKTPKVATVMPSAKTLSEATAVTSPCATATPSKTKTRLTINSAPATTTPCHPVRGTQSLPATPLNWRTKAVPVTDTSTTRQWASDSRLGPVTRTHMQVVPAPPPRPPLSPHTPTRSMTIESFAFGFFSAPRPGLGPRPTQSDASPDQPRHVPAVVAPQSTARRSCSSVTPKSSFRAETRTATPELVASVASGTTGSVLRPHPPAAPSRDASRLSSPLSGRLAAPATAGISASGRARALAPLPPIAMKPEPSEIALPEPEFLSSSDLSVSDRAAPSSVLKARSTAVKKHTSAAPRETETGLTLDESAGFPSAPFLVTMPSIFLATYND